GGDAPADDRGSTSHAAPGSRPQPGRLARLGGDHPPLPATSPRAPLPDGAATARGSRTPSERPAPVPYPGAFPALAGPEVGRPASEIDDLHQCRRLGDDDRSKSCRFIHSAGRTDGPPGGDRVVPALRRRGPRGPNALSGGTSGRLGSPGGDRRRLPPPSGSL